MCAALKATQTAKNEVLSCCSWSGFNCVIRINRHDILRLWNYVVVLKIDINKLFEKQLLGHALRKAERQKEDKNTGCIMSFGIEWHREMAHSL